MSPLAETMLASFAATVGLMLVVWLLSLVRRDASIIDPFWGGGFVLVAWLCWWLNRPADARTTLLAVLTTLWGSRLGLFLLWRNWGHPEDRRYRAMREHHGPRFWWISLFTVFLLQAALLWFVSLPLQAAATAGGPAGLTRLDGVGILVWTVGLCFEAIGDWQLARFQADPAHRDRVMDRGLWRWTRHPNYFGDFCVWWGFYLITVSGGAWWTALSPLVMSVLLLRVSGVTLLEKTIAHRRPDYIHYAAHTNAFFPGPRR